MPAFVNAPGPLLRKPSRSLRHRYPRVAEALAEAQALAHAVYEARRSVHLRELLSI